MEGGGAEGVAGGGAAGVDGGGAVAFPDGGEEGAGAVDIAEYERELVSRERWLKKKKRKKKTF